ncbi:MAG: 50S ribosomal protein L15 [Holosporales bacterium]|jgi:large subunit ribosomal protein L15|nr:50S ribosomal protein L15 [Holosporales bacterium]
MSDELRLNNIRDNGKARRGVKLLGRGIGSGLGKTSGRGGKGQTARSGCSLNGFEGGQTPLHRRLPKRGFVNIHRQELYELDFFKINRIVKKGLLDKDSVIDRDFLIKIGYMSAHISGVSLIANGRAESPVKVSVTRSSVKARDMLTAVGGTLVME